MWEKWFKLILGNLKNYFQKWLTVILFGSRIEFSLSQPSAAHANHRIFNFKLWKIAWQFFFKHFKKQFPRIAWGNKIMFYSCFFIYFNSSSLMNAFFLKKLCILCEFLENDWYVLLCCKRLTHSTCSYLEILNP